MLCVGVVDSLFDRIENTNGIANGQEKNGQEGKRIRCFLNIPTE